MICSICAAQVPDHLAGLHRRWHRTHGLHSADCALIGATSAAVCSCGLIDEARPDDADGEQPS